MRTWFRRFWCSLGFHSCYFHMECYPYEEGGITGTRAWWVHSCCNTPIEPVEFTSGPSQ